MSPAVAVFALSSPSHLTALPRPPSPLPSSCCLPFTLPCYHRALVWELGSNGGCAPSPQQRGPHPHHEAAVEGLWLKQQAGVHSQPGAIHYALSLLLCCIAIYCIVLFCVVLFCVEVSSIVLPSLHCFLLVTIWTLLLNLLVNFIFDIGSVYQFRDSQLLFRNPWIMLIL